MPKCTASSLARLLPLAAVLAVCTLLHAQATVSVQPGQCVFHAGDNAAWASPGFDDSGWRPYSAWSFDTRTPRIWVRCHTDLAGLRGMAHPALQVHLLPASELFVDGRLAGASGNVANGQFNLASFYMVPLAPASLTPATTIALRITFLEPDQKKPAEILAGDQEALRDHRAAADLSGALGDLPIMLCYALIGIAGFLLFGLFLTDRSRMELLFLAIACWSQCDLRGCEFLTGAHAAAPAALYNSLMGCGELGGIFWMWFVFRVAGRRVPWVYWAACSVFVISFFSYVLRVFLSPEAYLSEERLRGHVILFTFVLGMFFTTAAFAAFRPWRGIARHLRGIAWFCMAWGAAELVWFTYHSLVYVGLIAGTPGRYEFTLALRAVTALCCVFALVNILFHEQRRIAQERALLAGEMQAAREIQTLLAPATLETIAEVRIEVVFHPMRDVGGDFYSCRVLGQERQRILLGDVSGKGTAAAMAAALLLGGAADFDDASPATLLRHLDRVFRESSVPGFATCICAEIAADGVVTLANAGHLAPYCQGREIAVPPALPLGIGMPGEDGYEETRFTLQPGETLTFMSDGVVEAQSSDGELFGFERTREISTLSAAEIADRAQSFGQEDDITVLALSFAPAPVTL